MRDLALPRVALGLAFALGLVLCAASLFDLADVFMPSCREENVPVFPPRESTAFKEAPVFTLSRANAQIVLAEQQCAVVFVRNSKKQYSSCENAQDPIWKGLALRLARRFRGTSWNDILIAQIERRELERSSIPLDEGDAELFLWRKVGVIGDATPFDEDLSNNIDEASILSWLVESKCLTSSKSAAYNVDALDFSLINKANSSTSLLTPRGEARWHGSSVNPGSLRAAEICNNRTRVVKSAAIGKVAEINIEDISHEQLLCEYLFPGLPFVVRGGASLFPATSKWGQKEWIPDALVHIDTGIEEVWSSTTTARQFQKYISEVDMNGGEAGQYPWSTLYGYIHQHSLIGDRGGKYVADELWNDFTAPTFFHGYDWFRMMGICRKIMSVIFWSPKGARQSNHQDDFGSSKWQAQLQGRKKWILHPPEESHYLYWGRVDPFEPDLAKYPQYKDAKRLEVILHPGDIIFWTAGWWHATEALSSGIAVAQNILGEHNYAEFRRTSTKACQPGGSHGLTSPWCACFRRTRPCWDRRYADWIDGGRKGSATEAHEAEVCYNELAKGSIDDIYRLMRRDNRFVSSAHGTLEDLEDEILSNISISREG
eukprot:g4213.t1